jgi:hypothetical protein
MHLEKQIIKLLKSVVRSEFSTCLCAPTLREGVRVASRREAPMRLKSNPQFATILRKAVLSPFLIIRF